MRFIYPFLYKNIAYLLGDKLYFVILTSTGTLERLGRIR
ncbi:Hypothetical protein ETEE_1626 [Edwardsiella anguillarum ET080813]|uniref:Uncharacterized protein n=1 Tax=Edwardsiella anguillarum ET080813 TaxID=667120 RepID=A0A076LHT5_9GAMM|nr:Hypothetical protein ETEE_1626 [Edwardsiella anguillarum ET080813]